jgi:gluconate 2-dehydrogenase gamma chain
MSTTNALSRRQFLTTAGAVSSTLFVNLGPGALAAIADAAGAAKAAGAGYRVLVAADAADFEAMAARILPTTDTPGATEAGVVHFFDQAFAADMADTLPFALEELGKLNAGLDGRFADLEPPAQDALLRSIEDGPLFSLVRVMTIFGFFAMSKYGGNRNNVGWDLIGFEGHHGPWLYPFGYYDAEAGGAKDGD